MTEQSNRIVFLTTYGPEEPEKASLPFAMALGSEATDIESVIVLQGNSVLLAKKGMAEHVLAPGILPVKEQIEMYLQKGRRLLVCSACLRARQISFDDLIEGAEAASAGRLTKEFSEAMNVISY